jgi:phosphate transport system protein
MERHFHEQLTELKEKMIHMAEMVETSIARANEALVNRNDQYADEVIAMDDDINDMEILIDEICLKLLATQQPMAVDLRFVTSAMKINNDLERMGDHSVNIAQYTKHLNSQDALKPLVNLPRMATIVMSMVKDSLQSFVTGQEKQAKGVCERDDEVDQMDDIIFRELLTYMMDDTKTISRAIDLMLISKNLERIADLSTNIAEEVIFIYKARTIKHNLNGRDLEDIRSRS